jgi:hypothetical protein
MVPPARGRAIERTLLPCRRLRSRPPAGATGKQNAPGFPRGRPALSWRAGLGLLRGSLRSGLRSRALRSGLRSRARRSGLRSRALRSGLRSSTLRSGLRSSTRRSRLRSRALRSGLRGDTLRSGLRGDTLRSGLRSGALRSGLRGDTLRSGLRSGALRSGLRSRLRGDTLRSGLRGSTLRSGLGGGLRSGALRSGLGGGLGGSALRSGLGSGLGGSALRSGLSSRLLCSDHLFAPHRTMAPVVRKMLTRMHLPTSAMRVDALLFLEVATPRDQRSSRDGPMRCVHRSHHAIAIAWCRQRADSACTTRRARRSGRARVGRTTASDDARRSRLIPESQRGSGFPEYRPYAARSEQRTRGRASDPRG